MFDLDSKLIALTFWTVFVAELGDKTQLATLAFAAENPSKASIWAGAALALLATTTIGVLAGDLVGKWISPTWLQRGAGLVFVVLGAATLWRAR